MSPRRLPARLLIALVLLLVALPALATAPAPAPEPLPPEALHLWESGGPAGLREPPPPLGPFNYVREFDQMVAFLAAWQLLDPDSSDHGGMIEAEAGYLGGVIQTDNTLEAIWCWSRYEEFSGRATYRPNIAAAWDYCTRYPAWQEEGATGADYYRVHNCAWGLTAALRYEAVTGDASYAAYADTCANYIVAHPLNVWDGTVWDQRLDAFCKGWAAGNLYLYGEAVGDPGLMAAAVSQGADVKGWIDGAPVVNMAAEYWAMSSGTAVWGVCNSVFRDDPAAGQGWLAANAPLMDTWQNFYSVPGYDWDVAWNVAYLNAHFAVWDVTGDVAYFDNGVFLTDALLSYDTDDDGGIISSTADPVTEDMSWVSCYLIKFGVDRLLGAPADRDAGALRFAGMDDGQQFPAGRPLTIQAVATNYGLADLGAVEVRLSGNAGAMTLYADLPFAAMDTVTFHGEWMPPGEGLYTFTAATFLAGDEDPANDAVTVTVAVGEGTAAPVGGAAEFAARLTKNPFRESTGLRFALADPGRVRLDILDVRGRRVRALGGAGLPAGEHVLAWDGRDAAGRPVPAGLYLYRLVTAGGTRTGKVLRLR